MSWLKINLNAGRGWDFQDKPPGLGFVIVRRDQRGVLAIDFHRRLCRQSIHQQPRSVWRPTGYGEAGAFVALLKLAYLPRRVNQPAQPPRGAKIVEGRLLVIANGGWKQGGRIDGRGIARLSAELKAVRKQTLQVAVGLRPGMLNPADRDAVSQLLPGTG